MWLLKFTYKKLIPVLAAMTVLQFLSLTTPSSANANLSSNHSENYNIFFRKLSQISGDPASQQDISHFTQRHSGILTAFLNDLVQTVSAFEKQDFLNPSTSPAQDFANKWSRISQRCDSCETLHPVFDRLLKRFSDSIKPQKSDRDPLAGFFRFFQAMSKKNLNGFESLFEFAWPEQRTRRLRVYERKTITGSGKEEGTFIHERRVVETVNNYITFAEFILTDRLGFVILPFQETTLLHNVLSDMKRDAADPQAILLVQYYLDLIAGELETAWNTGELDSFYKEFFENHTFQTRSLALLRHPLFKPPYSPAEFQILPYYQ